MCALLLLLLALQGKKPRINWSQELHARFLNAMFTLGIKNAVPKTILQVSRPPTAQHRVYG